MPATVKWTSATRGRCASFSRGKTIGWIINCAAYTAVDRAEDEPELAAAINAGGVENLARLAADPGSQARPFLDRLCLRRRSQRAVPGERSRRGRCRATAGANGRASSAWLPAMTAISSSASAGSTASIGPNFVHTMLRLFREKEIVRVVERPIRLADLRRCPGRQHRRPGRCRQRALWRLPLLRRRRDLLVRFRRRHHGAGVAGGNG